MGGVDPSLDTIKWLRLLPIRWTVGGFLVALIWIGLAVALRGGIHDPIVGDPLAAIGRLLVYTAIPLACLGFVWGLTERRRLEQAVAAGPIAVEELKRRNVLINAVKAFACGVVFGIFFIGSWLCENGAWVLLKLVWRRYSIR